jgi:hypothetical protein
MHDSRQQRYLHMFTAARSCNQRRFPLTNEWIKKIWYMYKTENYHAIKKNRIISFAEHG